MLISELGMELSQAVQDFWEDGGWERDLGAPSGWYMLKSTVSSRAFPRGVAITHTRARAHTRAHALDPG